MAETEVNDPNLEHRMRERFAAQKFMDHLHARLNTVRPGFCEIEIPFQESISQQHGFFHAGIVGTVADTASGFAAYSRMSPSSSILTVEFKLNLLSPADGDLLIGQAHVLKYGRTLTICRSDIYVEKAGVRKLCAASQSTLIELPEKSNLKK